MLSFVSLMAGLGLSITIALPVKAQVRCSMPNGVVITQQLGACPKDAVQLGVQLPQGGGGTQPGGQAVTQADAEQRPQAKMAAPTPPSGSGDGMSGFAWLFIVALIVGLVFAIKGSGGLSGPAVFCTACGHEGQARTKTRGSTAIELVLWICFLAPGLIYSIWRLSSKYKACNSCGAIALVPTASPIAVATKKRLLNE